MAHHPIAAAGERRTGLVGVAGLHSPVEAGANRMGLEGGHHSLEEQSTARGAGIRLVDVRRAAGSRPAGIAAGAAAAGTRPGPAGLHTGCSNLASRSLT